MAPPGGIGVMLLVIVMSGAFFALAAMVLQRRLGVVTACATAGFCWSLVVIAVLTLLPLDPNIGLVPAEAHATSCSTHIGGPAPEVFSVITADQRLLNVVLFVPAGALLVLGASRWQIAWVLVPIGLAGLAAYSAMIELVQLELARLDRACDLTDVIDNVSGAVVGVVVGLVLLLLFRPWRHRS